MFPDRFYVIVRVLRLDTALEGLLDLKQLVNVNVFLLVEDALVEVVSQEAECLQEQAELLIGLFVVAKESLH